jgi:hypothetical protein
MESMERKRWKRAPALLLFCLSPGIGELLSSSAPPAEFFHPVMLILLGTLYGGGAIICRELMIRWDKDWASLLVLGAAYGIIEEALMVKSDFNPNWQDIGVLGTYARWGGVNWMWSINLTVYHAIVSIAIPVLLATLAFPGRSREPWVAPKWFRLVTVLFVLVVVVGFLAFGDGGTNKTPYRPPVIPYILAVATVCALIGLAYILPKGLASPPHYTAEGGCATAPETATPAVRRRRLLSPLLFATGFFGILGFFIVGMALPGANVPPFVALPAMLACVAFTTLALVRLNRRQTFTERDLWSLAAGALGFFILLSPLWEFVLKRPDNTRGMTAVGLLAAVFLLAVRSRIRQGERHAPPAIPQPENSRSCRP